ncbi:mCG146989 [Mus musculus]|nr:mCG146989 [Mus musculus]
MAQQQVLQGEVLQVVRQGAGWQQGGLQQGACTEMGWQQVEAQQQGLQTTAVQEVGQQVMGRQQPCCRLQGSQQMGRRQGSQMGLVQWGTQVTGRHTVVWQDTGRQQQGSLQQQGWQHSLLHSSGRRRIHSRSLSWWCLGWSGAEK